MTDDRPPVCDYEGSTYQQTFWDDGTRAYEDRVEAIALRRLLPPSGNRLLEVGAGAGRNTPRYFGFGQIVLLDYSRSQLQQARVHLGTSPRYMYVAADVYRLPFVDGVFDTATMIRVIHHMADAPAALREVRRVMQPRADFILEYANKQNFKAIVRWLFKRQAWNPFDPAPVEFAPLNFDFHPRTMRRWLASTGFELKRQLSVSHYRLGILKRLIPTFLLVWMDAGAQLTGDWWQLTPSVFAKLLADTSGAKARPGQFFRCPECLCVDLKDNRDHLHCSECGRRWAVREGIYDFKEPM